MKVVATGATGKFAGLIVPALVSHGIDVRVFLITPAFAPDATEMGLKHEPRTVAGYLAELGAVRSR